MVPVIRIDNDVMDELKNRAIALGLVFESPNTTLRKILGLDFKTLSTPTTNSTELGEAIVKNTTLILSTPWYKKDEAGRSSGKPGEKYSFETYMQTTEGQGYALSQREVNKLGPGSKVVLLRNDRQKRRAEGIIISLIKTDKKTPQGIWRYNVKFRDIKEVEYIYKPFEKVTRHGIRVIDL